MNFFESIIYGFVSGICEILPVSSRAHQGILLKLIGETEANPILNLMIHIGVIVAIFFSCRETISQLLSNQATPRRHSRRFVNRTADYRFLKNAAIPLVVGLVVFTMWFAAPSALYY